MKVPRTYAFKFISSLILNSVASGIQMTKWRNETYKGRPFSPTDPNTESEHQQEHDEQPLYALIHIGAHTQPTEHNLDPA